MGDLISRHDDFEKRLHGMFDHIWDCQIDHPIFDDTVGDLMRAVIQLYNDQEPSQVARDIATIIENEQDMRVIEQNNIVRCKDCQYYYRYYKKYGYVDGKPKYLSKCGLNHIYVDDDDFCSNAERKEK